MPTSRLLCAANVKLEPSQAFGNQQNQNIMFYFKVALGYNRLHQDHKNNSTENDRRN